MAGGIKGEEDFLLRAAGDDGSAAMPVVSPPAFSACVEWELMVEALWGYRSRWVLNRRYVGLMSAL